MKITLLAGILILAFQSAMLANGGASQSGVVFEDGFPTIVAPAPGGMVAKQ